MTALIVGLLALVAVAVWYLGPRTPVVTDVTFDIDAIGDDLDAYFDRAEANVPGLRDAARKHVVWAGEPNSQTPLAILYVHGFSASSAEIRPVPDQVAAALGANLVFTRLTGHGRDGAAMAEASVGDWVQDLAEGMAAARKAGSRVVILSVSTGGSLAALAPFDDTLSEELAGIAFLSPNFRIKNPAARLLTWPYAQSWVPIVTGDERAFETRSDAHAEHWTARYPTRALMPMAALVRHARQLEVAEVETPALFVFSDADTVVDAAATREVAARWGGPARVEPLDLAPGSDPDNHVLAGDILSPAMNDPVTDLLVDWIEGL